VKTYLVGSVLAFLAALALTPLVTRLAFRFGALDHPDPVRKNHKGSVPRIGGIALLFAVLGPLASFYLYPQGHVIQSVRHAPGYFPGIFVGAVMITLMGLLDDLRGMNAILKLSIQSVVAVSMFAMGFRIGIISVPFDGALTLHWMSLPVTVFWYLAVMNAINLIDGLDGLAAGQSLITCVVLFIIGLVANNLVLSVTTAILTGALLGFLFFNFNPARIFLGDSGSNLVGFLIATFAIMARVKGQAAVALFVPIIALGLPFLDVVLSIIRRFATSQPIFSGDAKHMHHMLLQRGYSQRKAAAFLYGAAVLFAGAGLVTFLSKNTAVIGGLFVVLIVSVVGIVRYLGYHRMQWFPFQGQGQLGAGMAREIRKLVVEVVQSGISLTWEELMDAALRRGFREVVVSQGTSQFRRATSDGVTNGPTVCAQYTMSSKDGAELSLLFRWPAEAGQFGPKPHETALLQVLVDLIQVSTLVERMPAFAPQEEPVLSKAGQTGTLHSLPEQ